jgi:hypothetical protein
MKKTITLFALLSMFLLAASSCTEEKYRKYEGDGNTPDTGNPVTPDKIYRGIGTSQLAVSADDAKRMAGWGVNHIRWNIEYWGDSYLATETREQYLDRITEACDKLEAALPGFEAQGITVNVDIHHPIGGSNSDGMRLFGSNAMKDAFVEGWKTIATRFKDNKTIVYYDLLNEPGAWSATKKMDWRDLAIRTADAIREIDNTKKFIFEQPDDDYKNFRPLPGDDWVYSIHLYSPHVVTHQGWEGANPLGAVYPGMLADAVGDWPGNRYWDKAMLRQYLDEVKGVFDFVRDNNVEIYVGEFGCARWAPNHSAYNYIRDCLEIFDEEGWHWTYFTDVPYPTSNYAANTWSCQYDEVHNSDTPVTYETDRLKLLKSYWAKNSD